MWPVEFIKPSSIDGEVTLNDINDLIKAKPPHKIKHKNGEEPNSFHYISPENLCPQEEDPCPAAAQDQARERRGAQLDPSISNLRETCCPQEEDPHQGEGGKRNHHHDQLCLFSLLRKGEIVGVTLINISTILIC